MNVREILASSEALKQEASAMWETASRGDGFTAEQKTRYEAIKVQLHKNTELVSSAAEIASFQNPTLPTAQEPANVDARSSREYMSAFKQYVMSRGRMVPEILAANVQTSDFASDGVLLPTTFEKSVVELANLDSTMRSLATIIPTVMDIPFPVETARGDAGATDEAPANGTTNVYTQDDPTFSIKKLSAYKVTRQIPVSEELLQDYNSFQAYVGSNLGRAIAEFEEGWFINGAGSTEPEGVVTGATEGVVTVNEAIDFYGDLNDLIGSLKSSYLNGASFLMSRATKTMLRKLTNDLGIQLWNQNEQTLFGYPVALSDAMPSYVAGHKAILFGNFKQGVIIGDRGNLQTRILDQVKAVEGQVVFTGKRRVDQIVVRPEAIKYLTVGSGS